MTFKSSLICFVGISCLSLYAFQAHGLRVVGKTTAPPHPNYKNELFEATQLNNILNQLNAAKDQQQDLEDAREEQEYQKKREKEVDECNVKELDKYFQNAAETWGNVKQSFLNKTKEMTLDFNASEPVNPNGSDEQNIAEALGTWRAGRDILVDLYANPENYGTLKGGKSFPLWKDQAYLYDKQLTESYDEINRHFGNLANNKPDFGSAKYNRNQANEIQQKHTAYLEDLKQKYPDKAKDMPESFNTALLPPKPLPPVREIVQYMGNTGEVQQVFPEWPQPWQEFINSNFEEFNLDGEMADDFVPKSFNLNENGAMASLSGHDNRLNQLININLAKESADKQVKIHEDAKKQMDDLVAERMGLYNLKYENNDWLDEENFNAVANQIKELKKQKIAAIREKLSQYPADNIDWEDEQVRNLAHMQPDAQMEALQQLPRGSDEYVKASNVIKASRIKKDVEWVDALEKDVNGNVPIGLANAAYVDQQLREYEASQALLAEAKKEAKKNREWLRKKELNLACPFENMDVK